MWIEESSRSQAHRTWVWWPRSRTDAGLNGGTCTTMQFAPGEMYLSWRSISLADIPVGDLGAAPLTQPRG